MPSVGAAGIPSLSAIEGWDTEHLASAARSWSATSALWERSFDAVHQGALRPGGTGWEGEAADAAAAQTFADLVKVRGASDRLTEAADIARRGADRLGDLKRSALSVIGDARAAGFVVGEDLSVSDKSLLPVGPALAARQAQAEEFAADIHARAVALSLADHEVAANIGAALAPLAELAFDEPAAGHPAGQGDPEDKRTVQAVDVKKSSAESGTNAATELLAKQATGEGINDKPLSADNPLTGLLGDTGNDAELAEEAATNGDEAASDSTSSPLAGPIVRTDPSAVAQQQARVDSARKTLDAAQAKLDAAVAQTYTKGGAAGPLRGDTEKLSQAVFDARRELTAQTKILTDLNKAAVESGLPTAKVPALPENADVQAFPEQPSAFAQGSKALSEGSLGLIPDFAKDADIFTHWGQHSGSEQAGAVLDAAGLVPIPGAKALTELAHGADALNAAHHASGALDDLTTVGHHAGDAVGAHHGVDVPSGVHPGGPEPGNWLPVNESMSPRSAAYQAQITGHPIDTGYVVNNVKFDAFNNGTLIDAKGYYGQFIENGHWKDWFSGQDALIDQANRQISVANGAPIQWVFAEPESARLVGEMLQGEGISGISIVCIPPK